MTKIEDTIINSFNQEDKSLLKGDIYEKLDKHGNVTLSWDYYLNDQGKKVKHGKQTNFYKDGSVQYSGEWKDGKKVGKWNQYRQDGTIMKSWGFDDEGQKIDQVNYDNKGVAIDQDKVKRDTKWSLRTNYYTHPFTKQRMDLHTYSEQDLIKEYEYNINRIEEIQSGRSTFSSASALSYKGLAEAMQSEIQIRKTAGRWGK